MVILYCLFGWAGIRFQKTPPSDPALLKEQAQASKNYLYTSGFCLLLAIFMFAHIGAGEFKDNMKTLKSRMFTVIK